MEIKSIEQIKDEVARNHEFTFFRNLMLSNATDESVDTTIKIVDEVSEQYAQQFQSRITTLEKHLDIMHKALEQIQNQEVRLNAPIDNIISTALDKISKI